MRSIDNYHIAREVISHHFRTKGLQACFLPSINSIDCRNKAHIHVSIWKDGVNATGDVNGKYGLSEDGESFIAGILTYYNALFHFLCPSSNSIRRMKSSAQVGIYKFWSIENKEAPIRLLRSDNPKAPVSEFEIKSMDHTANHYFALAAIVAFGIVGIKN
jgi:glutamine synthetase